MDLSVNARMAEYYERFIELQEKLRRSEEERLKLEMKFNEMMQKSREEEQVYYRRLRSQYKKFLEEDRKRQERNEKIVRTLERIETRIDMLTSKTERFKSLRRQYENYLQRYSRPEQIRVDTSRYNVLPKQTLQNSRPDDETVETENQKFNQEKMEILDRYLESISSQKCKEIIEKRKLENAQLEKLDILKDKLHNSFDSNKAQSIAEDIMNSIYNRHYNKNVNGEHTYLNPTNGKANVKLSSENTETIRSSNASDDDEFLPKYNTQQKSNDGFEENVAVNKVDKELNNYQNDREHKENKIENDNNEKENRVFIEDSHALHFVPSETGTKKEKVDYQEKKDKYFENEISDTVDKKSISPFVDSSYSKKNLPVSNETDDFVEITNLNSEINDYNDKVDQKISNFEIQKESVRLDQADNQENTPKIEPQTIKQSSSLDTRDKEKSIDLKSDQNEDLPQNNVNKQEKTIPSKLKPEAVDENNHPIKFNEVEPTVIENNENQFDKSEHQPTLPYDENGQLIQYDEHGQAIQYDQNGQAIQYDESGQVLQYDEHGQALQYDENGHLIQPIQYDENGQAFQYDENGQPIYFDENGQQIHYDENGQVIQYDEHGQQIQYDQNGQPVQYDENGQTIQYDANGQPIQYDANGQPIEYDANGQPIQYDANGQPIQYDANGQPIQYDANGQRIQYDANGQPIQCDANGQPIQYDANGQPIQYDENGQPIQYDENGQPVYQYPQYNENGQMGQQYGVYPQYEENTDKTLEVDSNQVLTEENKQFNADTNFGEEVGPTEMCGQLEEENAGVKFEEDKPKTNKILEMLDTDTESLQQNISKASNDSDFTVSS